MMAALLHPFGPLPLALPSCQSEEWKGWPLTSSLSSVHTLSPPVTYLSVSSGDRELTRWRAREGVGVGARQWPRDGMCVRDGWVSGFHVEPNHLITLSLPFLSTVSLSPFILGFGRERWSNEELVSWCPRPDGGRNSTNLCSRSFHSLLSLRSHIQTNEDWHDGGDEGRREEWYGESEWERTVSSSLPSSLPHLYLRSSPSIPSIIHTFPYHISSKPSILETEEIVREEGGNGGNGRERSGNRWMRFLLFAFIVSFLSPHFARLSSPFHLLRLVGRGGMVRERRW